MSATSEAEHALAALLHRLASSLGAIANYAHVLPSEAEARAGILEAMDGARATLRAARHVVEALAAAREPAAPEGVDLEAGLRAAAARRDGDVRLAVERLPRARIARAAADRLFDALLAHGAGASDAPAALSVVPGPEPGAHVVISQAGRRWSDSDADHAFDLFPRVDSGSNDARDELAAAGSLVRSLGGRAWGAVGPRGEAVLHVVLPAGP
jgi:hypothetical protein